MSHKLTIRADGAAEHAYLASEGLPWHGLGHAMADDATDAEWLTAAGMDWRIQRGKVRFATSAAAAETQTYAEYPGQLVLMRSDTKAPLAIVSDKFQVVQPETILRTLRDDANKAGFKLCTAGTMYGGRRFWAQVTDGMQAEIVPGDRVLARTLLVTATDGTMATTGKKTAVRVVCKNTQEQALGAAGKESRQSHRSRYDVQAMREAMGLTHDAEAFAQYVGAMKRAADKSISAERAERILFDLLKPANVETNLVSVEKVTDSAAFKKVMDLFNGTGAGAQLDGVKGTGWGFINAVTEYADHHARATSDDNRTNAALFGAAAGLKNRAAALVAAA